MCNADLRQVAVVPLRHYRQGMDFEQAVALPGAFQDRQVEMWFIDRARHQQLKNIRGWKCSHKQCNGKGVQESVFANATQLRAHAKSEHRAIYCETCFGGKKSFISEMQLYTLDTDRNYSSRLRGHLKKAHPQCRFCRRYYLDDEKLYAHLQESHESCFICERNGRMYEYYVNYEQLENHYRKEHYVCRDTACRGVVFATQIELQTHEHTRHNENTRGSRPRSLRVNLQQLHGERDPRRRHGETDRDVRIEQERQAARRRAFLSSSVVFSGALQFDDAPVPAPTEETQTSVGNPYSVSEAHSSAGGATTAARSTVAVPRRPDDGHFYEVELPRDAEELSSRKTILTRTMRSLLDPAAYEQFRLSSGQFQSGKISADEYYDAVSDAFGVRTAVRDILPELVALLPTPLLREPLKQTCLRKTDTKPNRLGYSGPSGANAGPSVSGARPEEQFPTLSGAPAPPLVTQPPVRRFGAPGPEDFPRLGRVNKPQGNNNSSSSTQPASVGSSSSHPTASVRSGETQRAEISRPQQTAASVLRQAPPPLARIGQPVPAVRSGSAAGVRLPPSAFPALTPVSRPQESSLAAERGTNWIAGSADERPDPDVAMRVGAVWGGAAANAHNRGGKKRGPGRGQGRQPASPPRRALLSSSDFPDIRAGSQSDNGLSSDDHRSQTNGRKPAVLDVMEIAKARRNNLQKSSLPKIGGSGYGFAWERKKAQQKRKQIKTDAAQSGSTQSSTATGIFPTIRSDSESTNFETNDTTEHNRGERDSTGVAADFAEIVVTDESEQQ